MGYNLIAIFGPTATGKTGLATQLAARLNGEIISADSRQVYKYMDIGTGKDLDDYSVDGKKIPYHMIDIAHPGEEFNLYKFQNGFYNVYKEIRGRGRVPILAGGTGLYINSVIKNYELYDVNFESEYARKLAELDEDTLRKKLESITELHNTTDTSDKERLVKALVIAEGKGELPENKITVNSLNIMVNPSPQITAERIKKRLKERLDSGMIEEAKKLLDLGITHEKLRFFGLEYKYLSMYLTGELNYNDMFQKLYSAITQFAKRQRTWFRKLEREGTEMLILDSPQPDMAYNFIKNNITKFDFANDFPTEKH